MAAAELEVLEANEAFYRAFAARDPEGMARLWAETHPVACAHPGWDLLDGREEVLASWRDILGSEPAPRVLCSFAQVHLLGEVAFVTCHEVLSSGPELPEPGGRGGGPPLLATNLFVREHGRWRMVHHQASPIAPGQAREHAPEGPAN